MGHSRANQAIVAIKTVALFLLLSCSLVAPNSDSKSTKLLVKFFNNRLLKTIYDECYQSPFAKHPYFEGSFTFEIAFDERPKLRHFKILKSFFPTIDRCSEEIILSELNQYEYEGPRQVIVEEFYFIWPESNG